MKVKNPGYIRFVVVFMIVGLWMLQGSRNAIAEKTTSTKNLPEREIDMAVEYPGVAVPVDEQVAMDIIFYNKGRRHEDIQVWVADKPEGWNTRIKTYRYDVTRIHVPSNEEKTLTFEAEPDENTGPGVYDFRLEAKTADGQLKMEKTITIHLKEKKDSEISSKGVKITTSYPVLRGPSDARFEFSIEVDSRLDKDAVFDLSAQGPEGWEINFKPAYESKYISSLRLKANQGATIAVEVKPSMSATTGEYPVTVRIGSGAAQAEAQMTIFLTGTYGLEIGTPTGLLSLNAVQGKPANTSFYIKNTGSAVNRNITLMSFKPENWTVTFSPETIPGMEPGELKQVEVTMIPNEQALVGDYSVSVRVEGEKTTKNIEFRVTVNTSSAWGWIGIGIIVLVIIGLTGLFRWLGRR